MFYLYGHSILMYLYRSLARDLSHPMKRLVTLHARAGGYAIGAGVHLHMFVYLCTYVTPKKFEWDFSARLTFSNTRGRLLVAESQ